MFQLKLWMEFSLQSQSEGEKESTQEREAHRAKMQPHTLVLACPNVISFLSPFSSAVFLRGPPSRRYTFSPHQYGRVLEWDAIKNCGFVHIEDKTAAEDAICSWHHYTLHKVCLSLEARKNKSKASTEQHEGNIGPRCTCLELWTKFAEDDPVPECSVVKDYAFVYMERAEDAVEAIRALEDPPSQGRKEGRVGGQG